MSNIEKLSIFAHGLLSCNDLAVIPINSVQTIEEDVLIDLINVGMNFITNSNIGDFCEVRKYIELLPKKRAEKQVHPTSCKYVSNNYDITLASYVNIVLKASNDEIERLENIINNYKKVV